MNIRLKAKDFFSVPNLISYLRLILIPFIIWAYCEKESGLLTAILVAVSGFTDVLDGKIARRFNMVTDIGKVLDPIADKLTQAAMMYCLLTKYELMLPALIVLVVKEIFMAVTAIMETKYSAKNQQCIVVRQGLHGYSLCCYANSFVLHKYSALACKHTYCDFNSCNDYFNRTLRHSQNQKNHKRRKK